MLRQRRGEPEVGKDDDIIVKPTDADKDEEIAKLKAELAKQSSKQNLTEQEEKEKLLQDIKTAFEKGQRPPAKSLSNEAQAVKDELDKDPYNMDLILKLGVAYAQSDMWDRSATVLMRGWKRVGEFEDKQKRTDMLLCLAQASDKLKKHRQALAIVLDITELEDEELLTQVDLISCRGHCASGSMEKALASMSKVIERCPFDKALAGWGNCLPGLREVGAFDISKSMLQEKAGDARQKELVNTMEKLVELRKEFNEGDKGKVKQTGKWTAYVIPLTFAFFAMLFWIERNNLEQFGISF